ncbi:hypothetical protein [Leptospira sp. GIMC2001]|uniref:hypothetical protein n=1 Tax=Leptospira sp. GIMC2001 TaxID=1513297 RepID=UPI00234B61D0|nr:hypothetical protein [Leptospira sp. GIMC2001]WCL48488.1 hypothetical protein O4O04_14410 [Leptospira sp. GIMC2001]
MNLFEKRRTQLKLSRKDISIELNIPIYTINKMESEKWTECSIESIVSVSKRLNVNIYSLIESQFQIPRESLESGSDEYEYHILSMAHSRMQMLLFFMDEFCKVAQVRKTDYNLTRIGCSLEAMNNLSYVTQALKDKRITRKEALQKFPPDFKSSKRNSV